MDDRILCPLINNYIDIVDCMENRDTREESIPQKFKVKEKWKEICKKCKYHEC